MRCIEARFEELEPESGTFDLVVSCIALHHVADKGELFGRVRDALEPGGSFLFADQMRGRNDVDCVWRNWMWGILTARA